MNPPATSITVAQIARTPPPALSAVASPSRRCQRSKRGVSEFGAVVSPCAEDSSCGEVMGISALGRPPDRLHVPDRRIASGPVARRMGSGFASRALTAWWHSTAAQSWRHRQASKKLVETPMPRDDHDQCLGMEYFACKCVFVPWSCLLRNGFDFVSLTILSPC